MPQFQDFVPRPRRPITILCSSNVSNRPSHGDEIAKKIAKKNVGENKVDNAASKKICICSPTNHAGSFRCHLHRATPQQLYQWPIHVEEEEDGSDDGTSVKLESPATNFNNSANKKVPRLSRFGRAAVASNN